MAKKNDFVQIHRIVLTPELRSNNLPPETHSVPLEMWVKGYVTTDAKVGDEVTVITRTGRTVTGVMVDERPHYTHSFGDLVPELLKVGDQVREIVFPENGGNK